MAAQAHTAFDIPAADVAVSAVSWGAIFAGGVAAAAVTLILLAFGAGVGFSTVSPWSSLAPSTAFHVATGLYFVVTAMIASAIGGYLAGRLRRAWSGVHTREVFFRDTAHGFLAWGFATLLSAAVLTSASAALVGAASGATLGSAAQRPGVLDGYADLLLIGDPTTLARPGDAEAERAEVKRYLIDSLQSAEPVSSLERSYLAQLVAARTGLSRAQAEERVSATIGRAKDSLDATRRAAAKLSLWLTASLLIGAFSASLAAIEGGGLRDGTWKYRV